MASEPIGERYCVTEAQFTFVAVDPEGPRPIPRENNHELDAAFGAYQHTIIQKENLKMYYVIFAQDKPNTLAQRLAVREQHRLFKTTPSGRSFINRRPNPGY